MAHPVGKTGVLLAIPAIMTTAVSMAPGALALGTIGLQVYAGWRSYRFGKDVANGISDGWNRTKTMIGFGAAATAPAVIGVTNSSMPVVASTLAEYNDMISSMLSAAAMWRGWNVIGDQFSARHGKAKLAQLSGTSNAKLTQALMSNSTGSAWKLAYLDKMGENAPEWLQNLSLDNKVLVGAFLAVILTFFHSEGCMAMSENTRAMDTDYKYQLEAGLQSESPANYLINPRRQCYNLYLKNHFYQKAGENDSMFQAPLQSNILRIIANIMIGMLKTPGLLNTKTHDPVSVFLKFAEIAGYWEVLARLIGMYGWAPVYVTTHWLLRSLLLTTTRKTTKKKTWF